MINCRGTGPVRAAGGAGARAEGSRPRADVLVEHGRDTDRGGDPWSPPPVPARSWSPTLICALLSRSSERAVRERYASRPARYATSPAHSDASPGNFAAIASAASRSSPN